VLLVRVLMSAGLVAPKRAAAGVGCCGPEKGRFVAESSLRHLGGESAVSARCVRGQCQRPTVSSVAACCVVRVRDAYTGRADGLRCVELLPSQVGAAVLMNSR
jgi:hypothetical protein